MGAVWKKTISPLKGRPFTRTKTARDGSPIIVVRPQELTPLRAKVADFLGGASALGLLYAAFEHLQALQQALLTTQDVTMGVAIGGPLLMFPILKTIYRWFMCKETRVIFTPTEFRVRRYMGFGWRKYDRQIGHKFALIPHDKTQTEQDQHEYARRKAQQSGQVIKKTRYYGESFHLIFEYLGQRHDVMTIYGQKQALRVLSRMKICDEMMDMALGKGDGGALTPQEQWSDQPGGI